MDGFKGYSPWAGLEHALRNAIRKATFFLVFLSRNSVNRRGGIQKEIREALSVWEQKLIEDIYLIPVRIEECEVPDSLSRFQWVNLYEPGGFERLIDAIRVGIKRLGLIPPVSLRSEAILNFSANDFEELLKRMDYFHARLHWTGKGINHQYEIRGPAEMEVVVDHTTKLTWQISGSDIAMTFPNAVEYIASLNNEKFAGNTDWRLPTLEEALSLMEPRRYESLFINSIFNPMQRHIWTSDRLNASTIWIVTFYTGDCVNYGLANVGSYVRAVR